MELISLSFLYLMLYTYNFTPILQYCLWQSVWFSFFLQNHRAVFFFHPNCWKVGHMFCSFVFSHCSSCYFLFWWKLVLLHSTDSSKPLTTNDFFHRACLSQSWSDIGVYFSPFLPFSLSLHFPVLISCAFSPWNCWSPEVIIQYLLHQAWSAFFNSLQLMILSPITTVT